MPHHEDSALPNEEDDIAPAPDYDPHHTWPNALSDERHPLVESNMVAEDGVIPKTLRQRAAEHYAHQDHVQDTPEPVQRRKLQPNKKTKRQLSSDSSTSESETMPSSKRRRGTRFGPSPVKRELRSGVRKSARTR